MLCYYWWRSAIQVKFFFVSKRIHVRNLRTRYQFTTSQFTTSQFTTPQFTTSQTASRAGLATYFMKGNDRTSSRCPWSLRARLRVYYRSCITGAHRAHRTRAITLQRVIGRVSQRSVSYFRRKIVTFSIGLTGSGLHSQSVSRETTTDQQTHVFVKFPRAI